jgi:hypothetical protein
MVPSGADAGHVYATERLDLFWEHVVFVGLVPRGLRETTEGEDAA